MARLAHVTRSSVLNASSDAVWARVTTQEGIDDEVWPLLRMRFPRRLAGSTIDDLPLGETAGRCWLLLGGVVPVDYDDLCLVEVEAGHRFLERSVLGSARTWEHERTVEPLGDGLSRLTDRLTFEPRLVPGPLGPLVVRGLFAHRHRRARAYFGTPG